MTRFTTLDAIVLIAYLAGTTTLGLWVGRKQKNASDYFVASLDMADPTARAKDAAGDLQT